MTFLFNYIKYFFRSIKFTLFDNNNNYISSGISNLSKYSKMYLNFIVFMFGSVLFISLYSLLHIIPFMFFIFSLLILSSFVIGCREFNINFTSSIINLVINRNYSQYLERFVLIKFFLFYIYLTSDYSYCASSWLEATHDIFVSLGSKSGLQPKTTVSTLETIGMIAIVGTIGIGSINLYNWSTGNTKHSIDERLNVIEQQLNINTQNIAVVNNNINSMANAQDAYAQINAQAFIAVGNALQAIEVNNVNISNSLNNKINIIDQKTTNIETTLINNKIAMENYINSNVNTKITNLQTTFNNYINRSNLTVEERQALSAIHSEITSLTDHLQNIPQLNIERSLPIVNSSNSNLDFKPVLENSTMKHINSLLNKNTQQVHFNRSHSTAELGSESKLVRNSNGSSTAYEQHQSLKIIIYKNKIKSVSIDDISAPNSGIVTSIINHTFRNIPTDVILKTVSSAITNTLTGSMTMIAFNALLNSFGFGSISSSNNRLALPPTSRSEQLGNNTMTSILDFFRGLRNGSGW